MISAPPSRKVRLLVPTLLDWFLANARDLPWRRTLDPYAVWISEIMLQQTQVKTVIPYWERWMRELRDIRALAKARPERVLKLWEGLGYYTRARNIQKAAQFIVREHGGSFPSSFDAVLALPGIGRYTTGAITSIAFNQPSPILDGNVIRVLTRLFAIADDPREKATNARLWALATQFVQAAGRMPKLNPNLREANLLFSGSCSALNQSLMELGALICTPRQAGCIQCPVRRHCAAHQAGRVDSIPNLSKRAPTTSRRFVALIVSRDKRWLVRQRPDRVVNAHLWEFPNLEVAGADDPATVASGLLGMSGAILEPLITVRHSITRYRISLEAYRVIKAPGLNAIEAGRWLTLNQLAGLPFTSAHRKVLAALVEHLDPGR